MAKKKGVDSMSLSPSFWSRLVVQLGPVIADFVQKEISRKAKEAKKPKNTPKNTSKNISKNTPKKVQKSPKTEGDLV